MRKTWAYAAVMTLVWSSGMVQAQERPKPETIPAPTKEATPTPSVAPSQPLVPMPVPGQTGTEKPTGCCTANCCDGAKHSAGHDHRFCDWLLYHPIRGGCCGGCPVSCRAPVYAFFLDQCAMHTWGPPAVAQGAACASGTCGHSLLHRDCKPCCSPPPVMPSEGTITLNAPGD